MDRNVDTCPDCGVRTRVSYTRNDKKGELGDMIRRRRTCTICGLTYSTIELLEEEYDTLVSDLSETFALRRKIWEVIDGETIGLHSE